MIISQNAHTLQQYDHDIGELKRLTLSMGELVMEQIQKASRAFQTKDESLAQTVTETDAAVNALEVAIDRAATLIIARHQPKASDLRLVFGIAKMATDLERMGDLARTIAQAAQNDIPTALIEKLQKTRLLTHTIKVVNLALLSLQNQSETTAVNTLRADGEVDACARIAFEIVCHYTLENPQDTQKALGALALIHAYERLGDHATNIAEHVIFILDGEDIRHLRLEALPPNLLATHTSPFEG